MIKKNLAFLALFALSIEASELNNKNLQELEALMKADPATQGFIVSHNNQVVSEYYAEGYSKDDLGTTWSIAKTFYAALIGVAIEQGLDVNLDMTLASFIPEFSNDERGKITLENLLAMKSGLKITEHENQEMFFSLNNLEFALNVDLEKPQGQEYEYNNVNTMLLNPIIKKIFGKEVHEVLVDEIFSPLGIEDYGLWEDTSGNDMTYYGIDLKPNDLLKFGQLINNSGEWQGTQIINRNFLNASIKPISVGTGEWFGLHWSVRKFNQQKSLVGLEVTDGEILFVVPEKDLVVVRLTKYLHDASKGYQINFGPLAYILWMPYSWVRYITELLAPAPAEPGAEIVDDPNLNIPNTQAQGISIYHCPFTSPDKCEGVTKIQDLIFDLVD